MDFLLDTCVFVKQKGIKKIGNNLCISDITLFERLKNKSYEEQKGIIDETRVLLKQNKIGMIAKKKRFLKLLSIQPYPNNKRIDEMCVDVSCHMFKNYIFYLSLLFMIIVASKNGINIKNKTMETKNLSQKDARFVNMISHVMSDIYKQYGHKMGEAIYKQRGNFNEQKAEVETANITIDVYNKYLETDEKELLKINYFNYDDLIRLNHISISKRKLKEYVDAFTIFDKNFYSTRQIYLAYIYDLLFCGGAFEYNDIVDINLLSIAISYGKVLATSETKIQRIMKNYEQAFNEENIISNRILIV